MTPLAALLGLAAGVALAISALAATGHLSASQTAAPIDVRTRIRSMSIAARRVAAASGLGLVVALLTRWPVAGLVVTVACLYLPRLIAGGAAQEDLSRVEAMATWAEMLRDTLAAAGGLQQSIVATAPVAPLVIRAELAELAERLAREPLGPALRRLAGQLDDPTADLVIAALLLAADRSPGQLGPLLGTLAAQARGEVVSRLRVEAGRARTRSSVRIITLITIGFAVGLVALNPAYVAAYDDVAGQLVLVLVASLFALGLSWIGRAARTDRPARFLSVAGGAG